MSGLYRGQVALARWRKRRGATSYAHATAVLFRTDSARWAFIAWGVQQVLHSNTIL